MAKRPASRAIAPPPEIDPLLTAPEVAVLADLARRMRTVRDDLQGPAGQSSVGHLPLADLITGWSLELDRMVAVAVESGEPPVAPTVTALVPNTAQLGTPSFTLHVMGTGFDEASVIVWNGAPEPTTFVSPTELTTGVNMDTAISAVTLPVAVENTHGLSDPLPFTFTPAA
jgi:hypothetical protein